MKKRTSASMIAAFSVVISIAIICSTQIVFVADAQMIPQSGYGDYGGDYGYYGQQMPSTGSNVGLAAGDEGEFQNIEGLEGFQGFLPGENVLSIAVIPLSQKDGRLEFEVIGFAISSPDKGTATVYSLGKLFPGVIDPSQNTLQIDFSGIETAIDKAGYIDSGQVYDAIRTDPRVMVIEIDMDYQGKQGSQTTFSVNTVDIVPPNGRMQAFELQQPTELIIDSQAMRLYMVTFPQMIDTFNSYYGGSYTQVMPVVYAQPVPIVTPIFTPYLRPFPVFTTGFVPYRPFAYGNTYVSFFDRTNVRYPIHSRDFGRHEYTSFKKTSVTSGQISRGIGAPAVKRPGAVGGGYRTARAGGGRVGGGRVGGRR